jgi:hypothetical protein
MPERRSRLRRLAYVAAVMMSSAAFALSLTGIATTQGKVKPNGDAAAAAKRLLQQQQQEVDVHDCHRHQSVTPAAQREV